MQINWLKPRFPRMRTGKLNLKSSFFNLLGHVGGLRHAHPQSPEQVERLRQTMLEALGEAGAAAHPILARQLRCADDAIGLWYARTDLMAALAEQSGESLARQAMDRLNAQFAALLPPGMTAAAPGRR
jgi:hypothetical protein